MSTPPSCYRLSVTQSCGKLSLHDLLGKETTLGSDASSTITIADEAKLLPRHILLAPTAEHCWVSTQKGAPLWDANGQPVHGAFVPWGSRLSLGGCVFELQDSKITEASIVRNPSTPGADKAHESSEAPDKKSGGAPNPIVIMLLLSALAYLATGFLGTPETMATDLSGEVPELFADQQSCSTKNPLHRARAAEDEAFAKSERAVFVKQDGIGAVQLFAEAQACYLAAGDSASADFVAERAQELRTKLEEEFKLLRMRLGRALDREDHQAARRQLSELLTLLAHQSQHKYVLSLRRLDLKLSKDELPQ